MRTVCWPECDLAEPAPDNEEGFWENADFVTLNNALLGELGGSGDRPPTLPENWMSTVSEAIREQAMELIGRQNGHGWWGWKDPRNSLTLPFWRQLLPRLKVVISLRNPLEVTQSLATREASGENNHHRVTTQDRPGSRTT